MYNIIFKLILIIFNNEFYLNCLYILIAIKYCDVILQITENCQSH